MGVGVKRWIIMGVKELPEPLNIPSFQDIGNWLLKPYKDQTQKYTSYYFLERDIAITYQETYF